jgi:hypothetical protein
MFGLRLGIKTGEGEEEDESEMWEEYWRIWRKLLVAFHMTRHSVVGLFQFEIPGQYNTMLAFNDFLTLKLNCTEKTIYSSALEPDLPKSL